MNDENSNRTPIAETALSRNDAVLVADLDGTLIGSDLLIDSALAHLSGNPLRIAGMLAALARGKAALKAHIAATTGIDAAQLPYDETVLALLRQARAEGRRVYLASASHERYVRAVAEHLKLFDGWFASTAEENLAAAAKARRLVAAFGEKGFDYIGNSKDDLPVWAAARRRFAIRVPARVRAQLARLDPDAAFLVSKMAGRQGSLPPS